MKRWVIVTVLMYVLILTVLAGPVLLLAFWGKGTSATEVLSAYLYWPLWAWVGAMGLAQAAMLVVPVRLAGERIVETRHVFWPLLAGVFLGAIMVAAMCLAVWETIENSKDFWHDYGPWAFVGVGLIWLVWTFLFGFYTGRSEPRTMMSRIARFLVAGSILEFLVAVPTHVIARSRDYCCAGFGTFWGLAAGTSVMLFAFGPAVFMLLVRRYSTLYRPKQAPEQQTPE